MYAAAAGGARTCLVIGGDGEALEKSERLLEAQADLLVVAKRAQPELVAYLAKFPNAKLEIREVRREARDVVSLRLVRPPGDPAGVELPPWRPGAHLDVVLPSGRVRQYSLCGDPADRSSYRIAVRRIADGGGGSREVHELAAGAEISVRGPRSAFPLIQAPRYLFLAGGIGITPILPMLRAVAASGADWRFVYAGRDRASMPFLGELAELAPSRVVIRADAEHDGPATGAELLSHAPGGQTTGYLCGPPPMLAAVRAAMAPAGSAGSAGRLEALHVERFAAPPVLGGRPFTVELEFDAAHLASAATVVPGVTPAAERRVVYTSGTMYEGIRTFKAVTTIVSAAVEEMYG